MSLFSNGSNASAPTELSGFQVQTSIFGAGIPIIIGTCRRTGNTLWLGDWNASPVSSGGKGGGKGGSKGGGQYNYSASFIIGLCQGDPTLQGYGPVAIYRWWQDKTQGTTNPWSFFGSGLRGQSVWGFLSSNHPGEAIGYSEMAVVGFENTSLGSGGTISNYSFEVQGQLRTAPGAWDSIAADAINFLLTNFNCAAFPAASVASMGGTTGGGVYAYCLANGLFVSMAIDDQQTLQTYLQELLLVANSEAFSSEGIIKFVTYGDKAASGNGATFTPNLSPAYALTYDSFITAAGGIPITFTVDAGQDATNKMFFEWTNRGREYNLETMPFEDDDAIAKYGLNIGSVQTLHSATLATVVQQVGSIQIKRSVYMLRKAQFTLGWAFSLLEPMDIVTVPDFDPVLGWLGTTVGVRLLTMTEDDNGNMQWEGEVLPFPILSPSINPSQSAGGYFPGYSVIPSATNAPVFFEATPEMLNQNLVTQLTLLIALSGGPAWGGCGVYVSTDGGNSYDFLGQQAAATPMGQLTADYAYGTDPDVTNLLSVNLQESLGELASVAQVVADAGQALAVIDQELISFEYATLSGPNTYDLESGGGVKYVRRGVFGSDETLHKSGAAIAFLDGSQFEVPYQPTDIGSTWYFKFPGFNKAGQQVQDVSAAVAYPFTLTAPYTRAPIQWKPDQIQTITDPFFRPRFQSMQLTMAATQLQVFGVLPPNLFSPTATAPVIEPTATVNVITGSHPNWIPGTYFAGVFAVDSNGLYSQMSNLTTFVITSGAPKANVDITVDAMPAGTTAAVALGNSFDGLYFIGPFVLSGGVITLGSGTSLGGPTPPDGRYAALSARVKKLVHAGILIGNIGALDTVSVTLGFPSAPGTNDYLGYTITNLTQQTRGGGNPVTNVFNATVSASSTAGKLTLNINPTANGWQLNDYILIRTLADTHTSTTIGCSKIVNPFYPLGMTLNSSIGNVVRIIGGTGAGQWRLSTGNTTGGVYTVSPAWDVVPDATSIFDEELAAWVPAGVTLNYQSAAFVGDASATPPTVVAQFDLTPFSGNMVLVEVFAQDTEGNLSSESLACLSDILIPSAAGFNVLTASGGLLTVDIALSKINPNYGFTLTHGASALTVNPPIFTSGAVSDGMTFSLYLFTDPATDGVTAPHFSNAAGGFVSNTEASISMDGTHGTHTALTFTRKNGFFALDSQQTGLANS